MRNPNMQKIISMSFMAAICLFNNGVNAEMLNRVVAIVEKEVVLDRELTREAYAITAKMKASQIRIPPEMILRKQVLERLIIQKLQFQLAQRSGIIVGDEMLQAAIVNIANGNKMTVEAFKGTLAKQGLSYAEFQKKVRHEIVLEQLRLREISSRIKVSNREAEHYLETHKGMNDDVSYHLGHILVSLPEDAQANAIQAAHKKANDIVEKLRTGNDFRQLALAVSEGNKALTGGDLGWRTIKQMPTVFTEIVPTLKKGDIAEPIRSPSGFHVIKVLGLKGIIDTNETHLVTKTNARHILIKTNEIMNDDEARKKLLTLKSRIKEGDHFETLARSHSDDTASSLKGGDLGWVTSGVLVPIFEKTMNSLKIGQISEPIQTSFGWHLIQVLARKEQDNSADYSLNQVKEQIRRRKIEEETELWMRRLRNEAYVKIYLERL
ncbi:MAG: peptidylprolyl isomerase [Methylococcales bacterium]|nr:peptidylprolyl isomerase [Methylococcales bacterium]